MKDKIYNCPFCNKTFSLPDKVTAKYFMFRCNHTLDEVIIYFTIKINSPNNFPIVNILILIDDLKYLKETITIIFATDDVENSLNSHWGNSKKINLPLKSYSIYKSLFEKSNNFDLIKLKINSLLILK